MKQILFFSLIWLVQAANAQERGCFELQTKEIFHTWDREIENYPRTYSTQEACQAAMSKIKVGRDGSKEVILLKSCSPCQKEAESGANAGGTVFDGQDDNGNGTTGIHRGETKPSNPSANAPKNAQNKPKSTNSNPPSPPASTSGSNPKSNKKSMASAPPVPATPDEQLAQTLLQAGPGMQDAISQYKAEQQMREALPPNYDTKPQGFHSTDVPEEAWVTAAHSNNDNPVETAGTWKQDVENLWGSVKDFFDVASTSSEILEEGQWSSAFKTVSDVTGYLETTGSIGKAIKDPDDYENRVRLIQDAFQYTAKYSGTAGVAFGKFAPPVDLYKSTLEAAFHRGDALMTTGDPGDELQMTAPIANWFGSMVGLGDLGTRERNYRMESYKSFSELKARYGYIEATKQKFYNWIQEDK